MKRPLILAALSFVILIVSLLGHNVDEFLSIVSDSSFIGGPFFTPSITEKELTKTYRDKRDHVRILIVPGHDKKSSGAVFKGVKEADINLELGRLLANKFSLDKSFEIFIARDESGYMPALDREFGDLGDIEKFQQEHKKIMERLVKKGKVTIENGVYHNSAPKEAALKLYGINKWASENDIDVTLHIHFNDHPGRRHNQPGKYEGYTIYVPEKQYSNSIPSKAIAEHVSASLNSYFPTSSHPQESGGVVEDQELIAIGSYNTLDSASLLIEYGYMYEPHIANKEIRDIALDVYAAQTYSGFKKYFEEKAGRRLWSINTESPYLLKTDLKVSQDPDREVFLLQLALRKAGFYPPVGKTLNECPPTGVFGKCTEDAVKAFQHLYSIIPTEGYVGILTRSKINPILQSL